MQPLILRVSDDQIHPIQGFSVYTNLQFHKQYFTIKAQRLFF